jgi:hypothetical protein
MNRVIQTQGVVVAMALGISWILGNSRNLGNSDFRQLWFLYS